MGFNATILADSVSPAGTRLTTFELTYPRIIHAEFMTHRVFSRNAASSRAIPVDTLTKRIEENPFVPDAWGANQRGMQAGDDLPAETAAEAEKVWREMLAAVLAGSRRLAKLGVHKQLANRPLEPFQWYTVIATATELSNFFALRAHPAAQPQIQAVAVLMRDALAASEPRRVEYGDWHLPIVPDLDDLRAAGFDIEDIKRISVGRCARVSYLTHDGKRDPAKDIELCERLRADGHMSPFEHVATPAFDFGMYGNFRGWAQMRKEIPNEADFGRHE